MYLCFEIGKKEDDEQRICIERMIKNNKQNNNGINEVFFVVIVEALQIGSFFTVSRAIRANTTRNIAWATTLKPQKNAAGADENKMFKL